MYVFICLFVYIFFSFSCCFFYIKMNSKYIQFKVLFYFKWQTFFSCRYFYYFISVKVDFILSKVYLFIQLSIKTLDPKYPRISFTLIDPCQPTQSSCFFHEQCSGQSVLSRRQHCSLPTRYCNTQRIREGCLEKDRQERPAGRRMSSYSSSPHSSVITNHNGLMRLSFYCWSFLSTKSS